ncbi:ethanolamine utilization protein [Aquibacillus halophilus]|uniref:Ethanolamine utilization protein n=1 Tax=Aquibacillus halophilus TaxID=930132 RepID=A0A6A8D5Y3_9BACI|nr:ethanolamine ammonia-lyase reactivating factor EutA [Aquibacillus halophilus]MRH41123.1 ethanolamine utilization protein [Aquibacillus halophilus]
MINNEDMWIMSAGIDLGTSTTKLIFSSLKLSRQSSLVALPRYAISDRKLLYKSEIMNTPIRPGTDEIDMEKITLWLNKEYKKSGINQSDIKTGAVIITGETANKRNAENITHALAEKSGDFVVASAGADLESLLAGKGAGAQERSNHIHGVVANLDIGGGTSNVSFFHRGKYLGSITFHVGGRLICLKKDGTLNYISDSIQTWLGQNSYELKLGQTVSFSFLRELMQRWSESFLSYLTGDVLDTSAKELVMEQPIDDLPVIEEVMISGGIGKLMNQPAPESLEEMARYGDVGPMLASSLQLVLNNYPSIRVIKPQQTNRATVIGAGMQSTEISGSTVFIEPGLLPLRNLPVLRLDLDTYQVSHPKILKLTIVKLLHQGIELFGDSTSPPFAIAIKGLGTCSYTSMRNLAEILSQEYKTTLPESEALVVICEDDMAKALGQTLYMVCKGKPSILCIDQISIDFGDFIDIGEVLSGAMVPVVIKTLAFSKG